MPNDYMPNKIRMERRGASAEETEVPLVSAQPGATLPRPSAPPTGSTAAELIDEVKLSRVVRGCGWVVRWERDMAKTRR